MNVTITFTGFLIETFLSKVMLPLSYVPLICTIIKLTNNLNKKSTPALARMLPSS